MSDPLGPSERGGRRSAPRLLLLTALFPGLGHLVAGRRRWAALLAAPLLVLVLAVGVAALTGSATSMAARLVDPRILAVLLVVQLAILAWRLFALGAVRIVTPLRRAT